MQVEFTHVMDATGFLTLELSTDDVETFSEVPADSWLKLAGKITGSIGMFFGFSLFYLTFARYRWIMMFSITFKSRSQLLTK